MDAFEAEFQGMILEVMDWISQKILPSLSYKRLNKRGHRICIEAKKDLFEAAAALHFKLGLPMTDTSFFFRGVNFEVKHVNTFGLSDEDLVKYDAIRRED